MKKVKYRQKDNYSCGSAALCNIFDSGFFLNYGFQRHERIGDLNKKLAFYDSEIFIESVFQTMPEFPVNNRFVAHQVKHLFGEFNDIDETIVIPFLVVISNPGKDAGHCVAMVQHGEWFYWIDSAKDHIQCSKIDDLVDQYHITGLYCFQYFNTDKGYGIVSCPVEDFEHII